MEREPRGYQGCNDEKKTQNPEATVQSFKMSDPGLAGLLALLVFL